MDHIRPFSNQNQTTEQFYVKRDYVGPKLSYRVRIKDQFEHFRLNTINA